MFRKTEKKQQLEMNIGKE